MNDNKVSIIIPAYNAEKYIKECLESVAGSTHENIECIVINDGSTDNTRMIVEHYVTTHSYVKLFNTENCGVSHARNIGIDLASGKYIMFLDADDMIMPTSIEILLELIIEYNADIATGNAVRFSDNNIDLESINLSNRELKIWNDDRCIVHSIEDHPALYAVWAKLYKKDFVSNVRFIEGRKIHEDSFFLFQLSARKPRMVLTDAYVYGYRVTLNSASRSEFSDKYFDILYFLEKKVDILKEQYPQHSEKIYNMRIKANMALLAKMCSNRDKKYRSYEKKSIRYIQKNKKYFMAATQANRKWFLIITNHLYYVYKLYYYYKHNFGNKDENI